MFFLSPNADLDEFRAKLGERIGQAVELSRTKHDAAAAAGITTEQLNKWIKGRVKVPIEGLWAIAAHTGVDFSWLSSGEGYMQKATSDVLVARGGGYQASGIAAAAWDWPDDDMVRLPLFAVEAAAGRGMPVGAEVMLGDVAFDRQFLRDRGASPDACTIIRAKGDSMSPTIPDGSLLVVDHSQKDVAHGYITVIGIGDDLLVKRVRRRLDGTVELISDNQAYPPEVIGTDRLDQLRVVGRVVYFCRVP